jgi:mono/diheme cytochrome c family protein
MNILGWRYLNGFLLSATLSAQSTAAAPVFSKDIAPIIYQHCASCHRAGEIAPMSLLSYKEVRPWAASIREEVAMGAMPPWHSAAPKGQFSNDRRLSDAEKESILTWVAADAPEGNVKEMPPLPAFTENWEIGKPDAVITMQEPYIVPASGVIAYQNFTVPSNFTEDKWVQAIEVRPGARSVVHHILVFVSGNRPNQAYTQIVPQRRRRSQTGSNEQSSKMADTLFATTAPGTNAIVFQPGTAMRVPAGASIRFQIRSARWGGGRNGAVCHPVRPGRSPHRFTSPYPSAWKKLGLQDRVSGWPHRNRAADTALRFQLADLLHIRGSPCCSQRVEARGRCALRQLCQ